MSTVTAIPYDLTSNIIAYEAGELDEAAVITLFAYLVKTGQAWTLQGSYGRMAAYMIEQGFISRTGEVLSV